MVPVRAMLGVPSAAARVQPVRVMGLLVLFLSSIHSSAALASVPAQAISLITTSRGLAALCTGGRVGPEPGVPIGSAVDVLASVTEGNDVVGVGVAVRVAVGAVGMVVGVSVEVREKVGVSVTVDGGSKVEAGVGVGVDVSATRVRSEGGGRVSWVARMVVLPRSTSMPISNREVASQQRNSGLAFMLSPLGCKTKLKMRPRRAFSYPPERRPEEP